MFGLYFYVDALSASIHVAAHTIGFVSCSLSRYARIIFNAMKINAQCFLSVWYTVTRVNLGNPRRSRASVNRSSPMPYVTLRILFCKDRRGIPFFSAEFP